MTTKGRMLRRIKRWLNKHYPLPNPCRVIWVDSKTLKRTHGSDCFGDAELRNGRFLIRLNRSLKDYEVNATMIHEWTHCLIYALPPQLSKGDHDEIFALIHTRILNAYLGQE